MTSCTTEDMTKKFKDTGGITFQIAHVKTEPLTFWFVFLMKASLIERVIGHLNIDVFFLGHPVLIQEKFSHIV